MFPRGKKGRNNSMIYLVDIQYRCNTPIKATIITMDNKTYVCNTAKKLDVALRLARRLWKDGYCRDIVISDNDPSVFCVGLGEAFY